MASRLVRLSEMAVEQLNRVKKYVEVGASFEEMRTALENLYRIGVHDGMEVSNEAFEKALKDKTI